ncbi:hypothetical protein JCM3770_001628 [Rhodotorula araucariae]
MLAAASYPTPLPTPPPAGSVTLPSKKQPKPPYLPDRRDYKPTHPSLFRIEFGPEGEEFGSCLRAEKAYKKGDVLCPIRGTLPGTKAYSSVQVLPDPPLPPSSRVAASCPATFSTDAPAGTRRHIELNSDLLYVNHSCDPNVVFDVNGREAEDGEEDPSGAWAGRWKVRAERDIAQGEILTFAYFSTEWDMDQPFHCLCKTARCLGTIQGAKHIEQSVLDGYFINDHILAMKALEREEAQE